MTSRRQIRPLGLRVVVVSAAVGLMVSGVHLGGGLGGDRAWAYPPEPSPTQTASPSASPTPTAGPSQAITPTPTPAPLPSDAPPPQQPGKGELTVGGSTVPVTVAADPVTGGIVITSAAAGITIRLESVTSAGEPIRISSTGSLVIAQDGAAVIQGSGFDPTTFIALYLYSAPVFLGRVPVRPDGSFAGDVSIPVTVQPGNHTIRAIGQTSGGDRLSLAIGVIVEAAVARPARLSVGSSLIKQPGSWFRATLLEAKAGCAVRFAIAKTDKSKTVRVGRDGTARVRFRAPVAAGRYTLTARVRSGCGEQRAVATFTVPEPCFTGATTIPVNAEASASYTACSFAPGQPVRWVVRRAERVIAQGTGVADAEGTISLRFRAREAGRYKVVAKDRAGVTMRWTVTAREMTGR